MRPITSKTGDLLYGAQVTVREAARSVRLAQPLYAEPTGGRTLPNPFPAPGGVIDFWLDVPQRVSVLVQADGHSDVLAYLDAAVPPEETTRTDTPLLITGKQTPGHILLAGDAPGQASWAPVPAGSGVTPLTAVISESFAAGKDPSGWAFTQASSTVRDYPVAGPSGQATLHARHTGNAGSLVATLPGFTLAEDGFISLWLKPSLASGESVALAVTAQGGAKTTLQTLTATRDWGFYRYPLQAGTYLSATMTFTGAATFAGSTGHEMWAADMKVVYGGQVPPHTHAGSGAGSVQLGANATAPAAGSIAIGNSAQATGVNAVAYGYAAQATGASATALGDSARAPADSATAIGARASGSLAATGWTAIGADAYVDALSGTAIGTHAQVYALDGTAIGADAYVGPGAEEALAIGPDAQALALISAAIGPAAQVAASHEGSVAIGAGAKTSAPGQTMLGDPDATWMSVIAAGRFYALSAVNLGTDGTSRLGFFGSEGTVRPVVTGSDGGNLALRNLLGALAGLGLITNNTTN